MQINTRKSNQLKKWAKDLKRQFSKETMQKANRHMKKMFNIINHREIQIKTTMKYHLSPARIATINKSTNNKCW